MKRGHTMGETKQSIRSANEKAVLREIFNGEPISRIQISRNLNLNKSTVSAIFNELQEKQLVTEIGQGHSTQVGGRKPVMIKINASYGYVMGFDIGFKHLDVMATYIDGKAFYHSRFDTTDCNIQQVIEMIQKAVASLDAPDTVKGLLAVGVAVHGIVFENKVTYSPFISMDGVDLHGELVKRLEVPVHLENEANLVATFKRDFSRQSHRTMNNIVVISIHKGIGAGIIIDHKLYRGESGEAGEIGRTLYAMNPTDLKEISKIEDVASQDAILDAIKQQKQLDHLSFQEVADLYAQNDEIVVQAIHDFYDYITTIIYNTVTSINPDCIYLSSNLIEVIDEALLQIQKKYQKLPGNDETDIRLLKGAKYASLLGGCSSAIHIGLDMIDEQLSFNYDYVNK